MKKGPRLVAHTAYRYPSDPPGMRRFLYHWVDEKGERCPAPERKKPAPDRGKADQAPAAKPEQGKLF